MCRASWGCVSGPMPFNIYIYGFNSGIEVMFMKFSDNTASTFEGRIRIQNDMGKLERGNEILVQIVN